MTDAATYRRATATLGGATVAVAAAAVALGASIERQRTSAAAFGDVTAVVRWELLMIVAAAIGALVARTDPRNRIGWWFSIGAIAGAVGAVGDEWAVAALQVHPGARTGGTVGEVVSVLGLYSSWTMLGVVVPLRFPDGSLRTRFRRRTAAIGIASGIACASTAFSPKLFENGPFLVRGVSNPLSIPGSGPLFDALFIGIFGLMLSTVVAVGSLLARVRGARGIERQQLKVVAYGAVTAGLIGVGAALLATPVSGTWAARPIGLLSAFAAVVVPLAIGVAVLRYRLYDVDLVVSRALAYVTLAALITGVYIAVVVGVGRAVGSTDQPNLALSIGATVLVAMAFQPARLRIQRAADRIVRGSRATPYEVLADVSRRLGEAMSLDEVVPRLAEAAAAGVGASAATVTVFVADGSLVESWPSGASPTPADVTVPVRHQGEAIGTIAVTLAAGDVLTADRSRLLDDLARHAAVAVRNAQLAGELEARVDQVTAQAAELQRSRQRIVEAQDTERKRVERDLHDGAQQRLVSLGLVLRLARGRMPAASDDASALLDEAAVELDHAIAELRDLARGIYPAVLVDGGLRPALEALAERAPVAVSLDVSPGRWSGATEATAYFVVNEALANVAKHAAATTATVTVTANGGSLHVVVADDGVGGATTTPGSGLSGLRDRVAAHGGVLDVVSPFGGGTRIAAELPCA